MNMKNSGFSERLKHLLKQKNLVLADVARAVNLSITSVHRWTRGGEIEYENLRALADFLEVNWIWLRYGDAAIEGLQESANSGGAIADDRSRYLASIMENESRLNLVHEIAKIVSWEWNVLTNDLVISPNAEQVFGRPLSEVRASLLPFSNLDVSDLVVKFSSGDSTQEWDFSVDQPENQPIRWFASRGQLLIDGYCRPSKVIGISIDITQRKNMRSALERSEYLLRKVIETIPVGLWIADQDGKITTANPEVQRIWGGAKFVDIDRYNEYKGWWADTGEEIGKDGWTLARAILNGEQSRGEIVNIEAFDGAKRTIIMSAIPLLDENRKIFGAIEVNEDITALKQIESSLRDTGRQWEFILQQPVVGIAYRKPGSAVLQVNMKLAQFLDSTIDDLSNKRLEELMDEETKNEYLSISAHSSNHVVTVVGKIRTKNGKAKPVIFCITSNPDSSSVFETFAFITPL